MHELQKELDKVEQADKDAVTFYSVDRVLAKIWCNGGEIYGFSYPELLKMVEDKALIGTDEELERYNIWRSTEKGAIIQT